MYVVVGSSTAAARLKKSVERVIGFPADVVHTPRAIKKGGCSYSVRVDDRAMDMVRKIACENGYKMYTVKKQNGERVYHAVS